MLFGEKEIKVVISLVSDFKFDDNCFSSYFDNEVIETEQDSDDKKWISCIFDSKINRTDFNKFLYNLTLQKKSFELNVDSEDDYVYEMYYYNSKDNYIIKSYVDNREANDGRDHLMNILFHCKQEKIMLEDFKGE